MVIGWLDFIDVITMLVTSANYTIEQLKKKNENYRGTNYTNFVPVISLFLGVETVYDFLRKVRLFLSWKLGSHFLWWGPFIGLFVCLFKRFFYNLLCFAVLLFMFWICKWQFCLFVYLFVSFQGRVLFSVSFCIIVLGLGFLRRCNPSTCKCMSGLVFTSI